MGLLAALLLRVLHFCYALSSLVHSFWRRQTRPSPQPLCAPRRRLPENLALVFVGDTNIPRHVIEKTILQSCLNAVEWCRTLGISKLTIYEEHGLALELGPQIRDRTSDQGLGMFSNNTDNEYQPLTPPESVYSSSCQFSPCHSISDLLAPRAPLPCSDHQIIRTSHRALQPISLCLLSSNSSKAKIANLARSLYLDIKHKPRKAEQRATVADNFALTVGAVNTLLETNDDGFSSPDFMIIHPINPTYNRTPFELHGFPPWHIRLTEIYSAIFSFNQSQNRPQGWQHWLGSRLTYTPTPSVLDEISFREALDEFAVAEMRFGK